MTKPAVLEHYAMCYIGDILRTLDYAFTTYEWACIQLGTVSLRSYAHPDFYEQGSLYNFFNSGLGVRIGHA